MGRTWKPTETQVETRRVDRERGGGRRSQQFAAFAGEAIGDRGSSGGDENGSARDGRAVGGGHRPMVAVRDERYVTGTATNRDAGGRRGRFEGIDELRPPVVEIDHAADGGVQLGDRAVGRERVEVAGVGTDADQAGSDLSRDRIGHAVLDPRCRRLVDPRGIGEVGRQPTEQAGDLTGGPRRRHAVQLAVERVAGAQRREAATRRDPELAERRRAGAGLVEGVRALVEAVAAVDLGARPTAQVGTGIEQHHPRPGSGGERRGGQAREASSDDRDVDGVVRVVHGALPLLRLSERPRCSRRSGQDVAARRNVTTVSRDSLGREPLREQVLRSVHRHGGRNGRDREDGPVRRTATANRRSRSRGSRRTPARSPARCS